MTTIDLAQLEEVTGGQNHATSVYPPGQDPKPTTTQPTPTTTQPQTKPVDCATLTDPIAKFYCRGGD